MPKGKLSRNKRKGKTNYPLEKKIKVLSVENLRSEDIRSKLNAGCLIVLKESGKDKQRVYEVSQNEKIMSLASKDGQGIVLSTMMMGDIHSFVSPEGYLIKTEKHIDKDSYMHSSIYNKLNPKLEIIHQNQNEN
jgi:hypothetical protein